MCDFYKDLEIWAFTGHHCDGATYILYIRHCIIAQCIATLHETAELRGLVQSPCGKINVIVTLTFYPPPPLLLASQQFG